jgi:hypothetical protein
MRRRLRHGLGKAALKAMRSGATLQLRFCRGRPQWRLSNNIELSPRVVGHVLASGHVAACNDGLFGHSQNYTYTASPLARGMTVSQSKCAAEMEKNME